MHEHLQFLVVAHVVRCGPIHGSGITRAQVVDSQYHRLLVLRNQLSLPRVGLTRDARRKHVVDRSLAGVLFDIHRLHVDRSRRNGRIINRIEVFGALSPVTANQVQRSKTQVRLVLEIRQVHTNEADGLEVANGAHLVVVAADRNLELIPCDHLLGTVSQRDHCLHLLRDML